MKSSDFVGFVLSPLSVRIGAFFARVLNEDAKREEKKK